MTGSDTIVWLGIRIVAPRSVRTSVGQEQKDQVKDDMRTAKDRGQERKDRARRKVEDGGSGSGGASQAY